MGTRREEAARRDPGRIARRSARSEGECAEASSPTCTAMAERIVELAGSIHAAEGELVVLLAAFHDAKGWMGAGIRSLEHWLTLNAGFTAAEGQSRAALSDRAAELPHLVDALRSGALSLGAARRAARVATSDNDEQITGIATTATAPQAAAVFQHYAVVEEAARRRRRCPVDADTAESGGEESPADERGPQTWWRQWWDDHGHLMVDGRLDPTAGAQLVAALDAATQALMRDRGHPTEGTAHARSQPDAERSRLHEHVARVDALGELAASALVGLQHRGLHGRGGERFSVHVTVDAATLAGAAPGAGVFDSGHPVDASLVRSWLAEARMDLLLHDRGRPLWMSRESRVASTAQRRALLQRDHGCAFPGCGHTRFVDAHHVLSWEQGGGTDLDNLVLLCRRHHRLLHAGEYSIDMIEGRPRFLHREDRRAAHGDGHHDEPIGRRPRRHRPPLPPRPLDPSRTRRSGEPLTRYGIDVYLADLLGP